jgi:hypothetical protein
MSPEDQPCDLSNPKDWERMVTEFRQRQEEAAEQLSKEALRALVWAINTWVQASAHLAPHARERLRADLAAYQAAEDDPCAICGGASSPSPTLRALFTDVFNAPPGRHRFTG